MTASPSRWDHRVHTEWHMPIPGLHPISPGWWGWGGSGPPPFSLFPSRTSCSVRSCWEGRYNPIYFISTLYVLCGWDFSPVLPDLVSLSESWSRSLGESGSRSLMTKKRDDPERTSITTKHEISINNSMRCSNSWLFYVISLTSLHTSWSNSVHLLQRNTVWYIVTRDGFRFYFAVRSGSGSMQRDFNYLTGPVRKTERSQVMHNTNLCWLPYLHTYRTYFHKESSKRFLLWLFAMLWIRIDSDPGLFGQVWSRIRNNFIGSRYDLCSIHKIEIESNPDSFRVVATAM